MKYLNKGSQPNKVTFPITQEFLNNMEPCDLVNPKVGKNYGLKIPDDFDIMEAAEEILKVRLLVQKNIMPWDFLEKYWPYNFEMKRRIPTSLLMSGLSFDNVEGLANIVHMDDPLDLPLMQKKVLTNPKYGGDANIKKGHTKKYKQFLETVVDPNETITDFQKRYGHKVFELKSFFGLARPEEVLPELGVLLTAYKEGCPCHGSLGQGHQALAQAGFKALNNDLKLEDWQIENGLYEAYLWGQFRCFAGVHYGIDAVMSIILVGGFDKYLKKGLKLKYTVDL